MLVNIGYGQFVPASRIIAATMYDSNPIQKMVRAAKEKGLVIDATRGRQTRTVIVLDSGHMVLSPFQPTTILGRGKKGE